jgi:hypothetical protein
MRVIAYEMRGGMEERMARATNAQLTLHITSPDGAVFRPNHLPVQAHFANRGAALVRLLRLFEPLPVFFEVDMRAANGTPIEAAGMGKADIPRRLLSYVELRSGEEFEVLLRLDEVIPAEDVTPGAYTLALTYHNQYGKNCFHGVLKSNTIAIEVVA